MRFVLAIKIFLVLFLSVSTTVHADIRQTKHNLSISGPGNIKASQESEICIFCHTPHNSAPSTPLWNRQQGGFSYTPYSSSTAKARPGQPNGASILCLSCHDGTIALGKVLSRTTNISLQGGVTTMPSGTGRLGTDLSDDHPVSFSYSNAALGNTELVSASSLTGAVKLDGSGRVQCTSCHDPHKNDNGKFLVMVNTRGDLCETCHVKNGWSGTPHNNSTKTWDGSSVDPWPDSTLTTVRDNACQNCHKPHSAPASQRLLKSDTEENICLACHNGHVATKNIQAEFSKIFNHPLTATAGTHDPGEAAVVTSRHVECVDCHNPHAAAASGSPAGPLHNVRGVNRFNSEVSPISHEYELCFRCHGDSPGKPAAPTQRVFTNTNVRQEFDTASASYHPVVGSGRNPNVPSLTGSLSTSSIIKCTDCHNNNTGPGAGGSGPKGPHGSSYQNLLERQYLTQDPTAESQSAYALCYKCHNRTSILGNQSFSKHNYHITGSEGGMGGMGGRSLSTPCNVCHDPHASNFQKLINFDRSVVSASSSGLLQYTSTGTFSGECYVSCHGKNHNPCFYGSGSSGGCGMNGGGGGGGGGGGM